MTATLHACRNLFSLFVATAVGLACAGCLGNKAPDAGMDIKPVANNNFADPAKEMPAIPPDAKYTIFCRVFAEDAHVQDARQAQQQLHDMTGMKKWYVAHAADNSTLYYGFYRCINPRDPQDAAEGRRAIEDQNAIRAMTDSEGHRLFSECLLVGIDSPDPQANPEWDITRTKGTWSIEIAAYTVPERKQAAVDSVREMRTHGIEAYYYHGPTASAVCIGCWPAESVVELTVERQNTNPDQPLVVTNTRLAPNIAGALGEKGIASAAPEVDIVDPTLSAALAKYKEHSTDGQTRVLNPHTPEETTVEKSFLFRIPHKDPLDTMMPPGMVAAPEAPNQNRSAGHQPDPGQLRSLGE